MKAAIRDIKNYYYTRKCFRMITKDPTAKKIYDKPKMTFLGVLYFYQRIPSNTPDEYCDEMIYGKIQPMQDMIIAMNLDGTVEMDYRRVGEDDRFYWYLVKIVPSFEKLGWWYLIKLGFFGWLIYYFIVDPIMDNNSNGVKEFLVHILRSVLDYLSS